MIEDGVNVRRELAYIRICACLKALLVVLLSMVLLWNWDPGIVVHLLSTCNCISVQLAVISHRPTGLSGLGTLAFLFLVYHARYGFVACSKRVWGRGGRGKARLRAMAWKTGRAREGHKKPDARYVQRIRVVLPHLKPQV